MSNVPKNKQKKKIVAAKITLQSAKIVLYLALGDLNCILVQMTETRPFVCTIYIFKIE